MKRTVSIKDLKMMAPEDRERLMKELVLATQNAPNGELRQLEDEVEAFEKKFGFDSETMQAQLASGTLRETWEICQWLMTLRLRDDLAALASRPH